MRALQAVPHARSVAGLLAAAALLGSCSERSPESPVGVPGAMTLMLNLSAPAGVMDGSDQALAKTDAAHVTVQSGSTVVLESTLTFSGPFSGSFPVSVQLPDASGTFQIGVELRAAGKLTFTANGSAVLRRGGRTEASLTRVPVISRLVAPDSLPPLTALGDSVRPTAWAAFATGDTIPGLAPAWSADGSGVVRITPGGFVVAQSEGRATLTAALQGFTATTRVRVKAAVDRVTVAPDSIRLFLDSTRSVTATARDRNGNTLQRTFTWQSSNPGVASVDASGVIRGVSAGVVTITASSEGKSGTARVIVEPPVASVTVSPETARIALAETLRLTATVLGPAGDTLRDRTVTWTSANTGVATVDQTGLVRAVDGGTAVITATSEGKSGTSTITVYVPIVSVTVSPQGVQLVLPSPNDTSTAGQSVQLEATAWDALGRPMASVPSPVWSSDDPRIADVDQTGLVTGYTEGAATITASIGGVEGTTSITVARPVLTLTPSYINTTGVPGVVFTNTVIVSNAGSGYISGLSTRFVNVECNSTTAWVVPSLDRTSITTTTAATLTLTFHTDAQPTFYCGEVVVESNMPGVSPAYVWISLDTNAPVGAAQAALPGRAAGVRAVGR